MTLTGHSHPLLVHFPIGPIVTAAIAELIAITAGSERWRVVAVANAPAGATFAAAAVASGGLLAVIQVGIFEAKRR